MKDDILNSYINNIKTEKISSNKFKKDIEMFSKFLAYTNPYYKYNSTYLVEFVDEFIVFIDRFKIKDKSYIQIDNMVKKLGYLYELNIDHTFFSYSCIGEKQCDSESYYIDINKDKIISKMIEISICFMAEDESGEYIFSKSYDINEYANLLVDKVKKDINEFIFNKKLRR